VGEDKIGGGGKRESGRNVNYTDATRDMPFSKGAERQTYYYAMKSRGGNRRGGFIGGRGRTIQLGRALERDRLRPKQLMLSSPQPDKFPRLQQCLGR